MPTRAIDYNKKQIVIQVRNGYEYNRLSSCSKEPDTVAWIEAMPKGSVLYDVGANVGTYSLIAAVNGVKVVAFEPGEANYGALLTNIKLNGQSEAVTPLRVALGDRRAMGHLKYSTHEAGAAIHRLMYGGNEFPVYPLDDVASALCVPAPDYIKIDVDGSETEVLEGAKDAFTGVKSALIEVDRATDAPICDLMASYGFTEQSRRLRSRVHGTHNVIFGRPEHA